LVCGEETRSSDARARALAFRRHGLGQGLAGGPGKRSFRRKPRRVLPAYAGAARVPASWHRAGADETADEAISRISPAHTDRRGEGGLVLPQVRVQARGQDRFDVGVQGKGARVARYLETAFGRVPGAGGPIPLRRNSSSLASWL